LSGCRQRPSIRELYRSNGFLNARIESRVEDGYQNKPGQQAVYVNIEPGLQWLVEGLSMEGASPERVEYLLGLLQTQQGQPFSEQAVAADRDTILNEYFNNGFAAASVDFTVEPDAAAQRMNVKFTVQEGRQLFVREVLIGGLEATDRKLIERRLGLGPGEPLSQAAMLETQRRFYDLGIFARVDMAVQNPDGVEPSKYVVYQFEEARKLSFNFGFGAELARIGGGITSFDRPAGGTGFSPRVSLGVTRTNFFGVGHTVGLQTRISNIQRRALASYLAPQFRQSDKLNLTFNALFDDSRNVRTFNARRWEGSAQLGQRLTRANTAQYRLTYRRVSVDPNTLKIEPQLIPLLSQPVRLGIASATFIQDRRDDPLDAQRGWYNTVDTAYAGRALASGSDFLRLLARNSSYRKIGRDLVFARSLTFGWQYALGDDPARDIPLAERFYSGGANSHRGFPENQAGPRDLVTGFPVGGKALLINSFELRFPLVGDSLSAVAFHDAGNVYSKLSELSLRSNQRNEQDFDYMVQTVGFGFRYRTPVGPVRIDLGYNLNPPRFVGFEGTREDLLFGRGVSTRQRVSPFQFHISLGQAF
jgi:outer membrane protein assembly complex protein YaeT